MKYKDLITFDPITSVVKLSESEDKEEAANLVKSFVFSKKMREDVEAIFAKNLDVTNADEKFGIQVVGSYGTGKSHLMALIAAIAEDDSFLEYLSEPALRESFKGFAGKYNVLRFEIATGLSLNEIITHHFNRYLKKLDVEFELNENPKYGWPEQIADMMAAYQNEYPEKHLLIVVDEMLEYLKGRNPRQLQQDLSVIRSLGEACDNSRFKFVFGVQELLYRSPEFQHQAEMLQKVEERYADLIITKEDISFVVEQRLLKKNEHQKEQIREHLLEFSHLFEGINNHLNKYVNLFPVHPDYIEQFEKIKHGKSQREILKVLSQKFQELADDEVPADSPGLLTYDSYWSEIAEDASLTSIPDIRKVKDKMGIIKDRIESHFSDKRTELKPIAHKVSHSLAIKALCDDLDKKNGATAKALKESLCITDQNADEPDLLTAQIERTAEQLIKATNGQYFDKSTDNEEYYLRVEGGVNVQQRIKEYAEEVLSKEPKRADEYFFDFLQHELEMKENTYRSGFKIWQHAIEWKDKKTFRRGYIFFGNPNERSTTEPEEDFYLFFSPIFGKYEQNNESDEIYFDLTGLSEDFREAILLYGAAKAKHASATSDQKKIYRSQIEEYKNRALNLFNSEYVSIAKVIHHVPARKKLTQELQQMQFVQYS